MVAKIITQYCEILKIIILNQVYSDIVVYTHLHYLV